jgi:hypothetical protein
VTYALSACARVSRAPPAERHSAFPKYTSAWDHSGSHSRRPNRARRRRLSPPPDSHGAVPGIAINEVTSTSLLLQGVGRRDGRLTGILPAPGEVWHRRRWGDMAMVDERLVVSPPEPKRCRGADPASSPEKSRGPCAPPRPRTAPDAGRANPARHRPGSGRPLPVEPQPPSCRLPGTPGPPTAGAGAAERSARHRRHLYGGRADAAQVRLVPRRDRGAADSRPAGVRSLPLLVPPGVPVPGVAAHRCPGTGSVRAPAPGLPA